MLMLTDTTMTSFRDHARGKIVPDDADVIDLSPRDANGSAKTSLGLGYVKATVTCMDDDGPRLRADLYRLVGKPAVDIPGASEGTGPDRVDLAPARELVRVCRS
jgi:hypothetical protein